MNSRAGEDCLPNWIIKECLNKERAPMLSWNNWPKDKINWSKDKINWPKDKINWSSSKTNFFCQRTGFGH